MCASACLGSVARQSKVGAVLTDIIMALHHGFHEVSVTAWRVVDGGSLSRKYISDEMPCCFNERHGAPERPPPKPPQASKCVEVCQPRYGVGGSPRRSRGCSRLTLESRNIPATINSRAFSRRCKLRAFSEAFFPHSLRGAMYPDSPVSAKHNVLAGEEAVRRGDNSCTSQVARCSV